MVVLLRAQIPDDLLNRLVSQIGFRNLDDRIELRRPHLREENLEDLFTELSPYYIPYAAKKYLVADITLPRYLTILRHCLRQRGRDVLSRETSERGKKIMCYSLSRPAEAPKEVSFEVEFA